MREKSKKETKEWEVENGVIPAALPNELQTQTKCFVWIIEQIWLNFLSRIFCLTLSFSEF